MLAEELGALYRRVRLNHYRFLFGRIREKDGSLSATEAYTVDVIYLLNNPTVTQLAETLGISQPNATYKVNNLVNKGYVVKVPSSDDRRECRLIPGPKFHQYFNDSGTFLQDASDRLAEDFSPEELETFSRVFRALTDVID